MVLSGCGFYSAPCYQGMIWPAIVAPYRVCIVVAAAARDDHYQALVQAAEQVYDHASASIPALAYGELRTDCGA